jgi:hypothetical protein
MHGPRHNWKKELGLCVNEIKQEDWFKSLTSEEQKELLQQTKERMSPPNNMANTVLNLVLENTTWHEEASKAGWENTLAPCGVDKTEYFSNYFFDNKLWSKT